MKLKIFACKRDNGYCGGLIVVAAHNIEEAYTLYEKYVSEHYYIDSDFENNNEYPRQKWYQIPDIAVECDSPRVIDEDH